MSEQAVKERCVNYMSHKSLWKKYIFINMLNMSNKIDTCCLYHRLSLILLYRKYRLEQITHNKFVRVYAAHYLEI